MTKYICRICRYKFKSKEKQKTCPYCGKNGLEQEKSAEEIISSPEFE